MTKPKNEYRVVCAHFGTGSRHSAHKWEKRSKDAKHKAKQAVIDLNHHADVTRPEDSFYRNEAPYRVQIREVTAWTDDE